MLDTLIIGGLSGALILFLIWGLGITLKIIKARKKDSGWKESILGVLGRNIFNWLSVIFFVLFTLLIIMGLGVSIFAG